MFQAIRKPFLIEFFTTKKPTAFHPQSNGIYERFHGTHADVIYFFTKKYEGGMNMFLIQ
jgi:hypothetical protein